MTEEIAEFVKALRQAGVRVSLAETLDACEGLRHIDVENRGDFRLALQAALVKEPRDVPPFEALFEQHFRWHRPAKKKREPHRQTHRDEGTAPRPGGDQPGGRRPMPRQQPTPARAEVPGPDARPAQTPQRRPDSPPGEQRPDPNERPPDSTAPRPEETPPERREALAAMLAALEEGMSEARREALRSAASARRDLQQRDLKQRLSTDEAREAAAEVERLARRLVSRESLRLRRARRGKVDIKGTLARSARTGGIPFHVARRRRARTRQKLLVLCDVSGSVWNVAGFLLRLVHLLQNRFSRTRSLVFVDRPVDVTPLFERYPFEDALRRLRDHPDLNLTAYSDFGNTFYELLDDFATFIDRDTVLLVLGDARTNRFDPMEWALAELTQRVRRVVWLNPEPPSRWNTHDSVIETYAPYCDTLLPCSNLAELAQAAQVLARA